MVLSPADQEFLDQLNTKIAEHLSNEHFGVSELADAMNMSRSNLLRKVKKATNLSVSQLINEARLKQGMELLITTAFNVSEVAVQVGFNSPSYFIKCFREYYGYPPGEAGKRAKEPVLAPASLQSSTGENKNLKGTLINSLYPSLLENGERMRPSKGKVVRGALKLILGLASGAVVIGWLTFSLWPATEPRVSESEKSIVVLPFKNDSNDSTNVYLINGLMESTLSNLQKIKDLKVISRTSAEKFRHNNKTIPEMAQELKATYFVEGSGQKIGDKIVLNIQLIDATDHHLWSRQYRREAHDIFTLQQEIAKDIAFEIRAVITPIEKSRIEKIYTKNAKAYDLFLKGLDLLQKGGDENLEASILLFKEATQKDNSFALSYACAAVACYYLDIYKQEKSHADALASFADNAMLHDATLGEALTAKALHYLLRKEYSQALPYLEKGFEYSPNSTLIIGLLTDFYALYLPNTSKYLEYALMGLRLHSTSPDSVEQSYLHLRLGNALIQNGFIDQSLTHLDLSIQYFSRNPYARYVRSFVLYAKHGDLKATRQLLAVEFNKDTTRYDILQDIAKLSYYLGDYDSAFKCYQRFNRYRETMKLDVYQHENIFVAKVYDSMGEKEKAKEFYLSYKQYLERDQSAYKNLGLAFAFCYEGNKKKALEHMELFTKEENIQYWFILFLDKDPHKTELENAPEFKKLVKAVETKFWANHKQMKDRLTEQGLLAN